MNQVAIYWKKEKKKNYSSEALKIAITLAMVWF